MHLLLLGQPTEWGSGLSGTAYSCACPTGTAYSCAGPTGNGYSSAGSPWYSHNGLQLPSTPDLSLSITAHTPQELNGKFPAVLVLQQRMLSPDVHQETHQVGQHQAHSRSTFQLHKCHSSSFTGSFSVKLPKSNHTLQALYSLKHPQEWCYQNSCTVPLLCKRSQPQSTVMVAQAPACSHPHIPVQFPAYGRANPGDIGRSS